MCQLILFIYILLKKCDCQKNIYDYLLFIFRSVYTRATVGLQLGSSVCRKYVYVPFYNPTIFSICKYMYLAENIKSISPLSHSLFWKIIVLYSNVSLNAIIQIKWY